MQIRPATHADIPRLCELLALLFEQEAEFTPDAVKQTAGLRAILADPAIGRILVLEEDARIEGMVSLLFTISTFLGGRVALLEDMIVDPAARGRGHGQRLLQAAIALARESGCQRITLLTDGVNEQAKAFYRRGGFVESAMMPLRLQLET